MGLSKYLKIYNSIEKGEIIINSKEIKFYLMIFEYTKKLNSLSLELTKM